MYDGKICRYQIAVEICPSSIAFCVFQRRIPDFKLGGGAHLKKMRRAEGGAKIFGIFRVKNHDFTPKNHIFSNCGGRCEHFWGISCEKSRFYAKKIIFFPILGGGRPWCGECQQGFQSKTLFKSHVLLHIEVCICLTNHELLDGCH